LSVGARLHIILLLLYIGYVYCRARRSLCTSDLLDRSRIVVSRSHNAVTTTMEVRKSYRNRVYRMRDIIHRTSIINAKPKIDSNIILYHYSGRDNAWKRLFLFIYIIFYDFHRSWSKRLASVVCVYSSKQTLHRHLPRRLYAV